MTVVWVLGGALAGIVIVSGVVALVMPPPGLPLTIAGWGLVGLGALLGYKNAPANRKRD
jgi:hypothetical protein